LENIHVLQVLHIYKSFRHRITVFLGRDIFYPSAGGSDDWAHMNGIDLSFTFELRDSGSGFILPEFLIKPAVEETARGISAVYDHLLKLTGTDVGKDIENQSSGPAQTTPKPIKQLTQCKENPNEYFAAGGVNVPEYKCNMRNGQCSIQCPNGFISKAKKVTCKKGKNWKPSSTQVGDEICIKGLFKFRIAFKGFNESEKNTKKYAL
jgi:hypothetical protein